MARGIVPHRRQSVGVVSSCRFLAGVGGEQFALPDSVEVARTVRRTRLSGQRIEVAAVDPLNLTGIVTPGPRVPAVLGQKVLYVDGIPQEPAPTPEAPPAVAETALAS